MGRKQVLVQLDDDLVEALDRAAAAEGVSRSELIRRGARAILDARLTLQKERDHAEAYRKTPQDPVLGEALHRAAIEAMPEW